jgi:hypothetical protein
MRKSWRKETKQIRKLAKKKGIDIPAPSLESMQEPKRAIQKCIDEHLDEKENDGSSPKLQMLGSNEALSQWPANQNAGMVRPKNDSDDSRDIAMPAVIQAVFSAAVDAADGGLGESICDESKPDPEFDTSLVRRGRWLPEEHALFQEAMQKHPYKWREVARVVKTRTELQCRTHAQKTYTPANPSPRKRPKMEINTSSGSGGPTSSEDLNGALALQFLASPHPGEDPPKVFTFQEKKPVEKKTFAFQEAQSVEKNSSTFQEAQPVEKKNFTFQETQPVEKYDCAAALRLLQHSPSPNTPDKFWSANEPEQKKELWAQKKSQLYEKDVAPGDMQGIQPLPPMPSAEAGAAKDSSVPV